VTHVPAAAGELVSGAVGDARRKDQLARVAHHRHAARHTRTARLGLTWAVATVVALMLMLIGRGWRRPLRDADRPAGSEAQWTGPTDGRFAWARVTSGHSRESRPADFPDLLRQAGNGKRLAGKSRRGPLVPSHRRGRRHTRGVRAKRRRACGGGLPQDQPRVLCRPFPAQSIPFRAERAAAPPPALSRRMSTRRQRRDDRRIVRRLKHLGDEPVLVDLARLIRPRRLNDLSSASTSGRSIISHHAPPQRPPQARPPLIGAQVWPSPEDPWRPRA